MIDYISKMKSIVDNLIASRAPLTDENLIMNLQTGVRVEYDPVFVIIATRPELFTLSEVCALLQNHEARIKQLNSCTQIVSKMSLLILQQVVLPRMVVVVEILMGMTGHILEVITVFIAVSILVQGVVVVVEVMDCAQLAKFVVDKDTLL